MKRKITLELEKRQTGDRTGRFESESNGSGVAGGESPMIGDHGHAAHPSIPSEAVVQGTRLQVRLRVDGLDRYHVPGAPIMVAGALGMSASLWLGFGPLWAGFLAGAVPAFLIASLVHPEHA